MAESTGRLAANDAEGYANALLYIAVGQGRIELRITLTPDNRAYQYTVSCPHGRSDAYRPRCAGDRGRPDERVIVALVVRRRMEYETCRCALAVWKRYRQLERERYGAGGEGER